MGSDPINFSYATPAVPEPPRLAIFLLATDWFLVVRSLARVPTLPRCLESNPSPYLSLVVTFVIVVTMYKYYSLSA